MRGGLLVNFPASNGWERSFLLHYYFITAPVLTVPMCATELVLIVLVFLTVLVHNCPRSYCTDVA
jgi:hypothetical protein